MSSVENVVIAAAGMSTRLDVGRPKCLVEVCGRKIIEYQLALLKEIPHLYMVVGFCEQEVIDFVSKLRRDVIFVRNPGFQHTKTLESYYLASRVIDGKTVFMDGNMILEPASFQRFLRQGAEQPLLIAVSRRISEDPVYANMQTEEPLVVRDFSYTEKSGYEWAKTVVMEASQIRGGKTHVFEYLRGFLPTQAAVIDRMEIDTPEDLRYAEKELRSGKAWNALTADVLVPYGRKG